MKITPASTAPIARDLTGCAGLALVVEGVREIYGPAGLIVAGVGLVAGALQLARRG